MVHPELTDAGVLAKLEVPFEPLNASENGFSADYFIFAYGMHEGS